MDKAVTALINRLQGLSEQLPKESESHFVCKRLRVAGDTSAAWLRLDQPFLEGTAVSHVTGEIRGTEEIRGTGELSQAEGHQGGQPEWLGRHQSRPQRHFPPFHFEHFWRRQLFFFSC